MANEKPINNRELWVDYCKAIGIILVVYGHVARGIHHAGLEINETFFRVVDIIIYSFHMPLFFFLSGLFFYRSLSKRSFIGFFNHKLDYILYPYILWSIFQGVIEVNLAQYTNGDATYNEVFSLLW